MHVETCPFEGERIFFENAGGSLRLKSVVETSALYASYPDNQGRENDASKSLVKSIENGKAKMRLSSMQIEVMLLLVKVVQSYFFGLYEQRR